MLSFGPDLESRGVRYLLISGQATILYGAATFSEDVDLWIEPGRENVRRLLRALAEARARVYKLTPPLTSNLLRRGHGFHFVVPAPEGEVFLDVMGAPPRVGSFEASWRRKRSFETPWAGSRRCVRKISWNSR
jgi:hypothetical protein